MNLINQETKIIEQEYGSTKKELLVNMFKHIERCARTCYKSEDKITDKSYIKMIHNLITNKHFAMLEFGTMYFDVPNSNINRDIIRLVCGSEFIRWEINNKTDTIFITTNYRYYLEHNILYYFNKYLCRPTEFHEKRLTYKFTTNRAIANELVRHRVFSFAQESTRFCNYSKDKYDEGLTFIRPNWLKFKDHSFVQALRKCEQAYLELIYFSHSPQEARDILPLALKTEICMCGFESDWDRLYDIRVNGVTGTPHPMIKELISKIKE